jgi:hypothetical protein
MKARITDAANDGERATMGSTLQVLAATVAGMSTERLPVNGRSALAASREPVCR